MGLWVENSFYFEPAESISIFIPRVFESQFIKIKTGKNKYILVGNIYRPNSAPYANIKYFNQTISDIFSKIKSDVNFKNLNEVIGRGYEDFINQLKQPTLVRRVQTT